MNANLQAAVDDCKKVSNVVYAETVGKFNEENDFEGKTQPRDFVLSEAVVAYYEKKKVKKQKYFTTELTSATYNEQNHKISLEFAHGEYFEQMVFETHNHEAARTKLGNFFGRFFTNNDKINKNFDGFNVDVVNTTYSVISRFIASSVFRSVAKDPRQKGLDFLTNILKNRPESISIPSESVFSTILYDILYALQAYPYGKSLTLNYIEGYDIYLPLVSLSDNFSFEHIAIVSPFTANTAKFLKKAGVENSFRTSNITFCYSQLDDTGVEAVKEFVINKRSTTLSLVNAFRENTINSLYTTMLTPDTLQNVQYLSLDQTPNIDLNMVMSHLNSIQVLSLEGCQLDVNSALNRIFNFVLPNLKCVNLSGNVCNTKIDDNTVFPKTLTRLDVTYVTWAPGTIQSLFKAISDSEFDKKFSIYACAIQGDQTSDANEALTYLTKSKSLQINGFGWADNFCSDELIAFLKAKKPRILDLSRLNNELSFISQISDVMEVNHSIVEFTLQGLNSGDYALAQLIDNIQTDKLKLLDVSRASNNTQVAQSIANLISRSQVTDIGADGCSKDDMMTIIDAAKAAGRPIRVAYPTATLSEATPEDTAAVVEAINVAEQHRVRPDPEDFLTQPFDGPSLRLRTRFPRYMGETMREEAEGAAREEVDDSDSDSSDTDSDSDKEKDTDSDEPKKKPSKRQQKESDTDSDEDFPKKKPMRKESDTDSDSDSDTDFEEPKKKPSKKPQKESDTDSDSDTDFEEPKKKPSKRQQKESDTDSDEDFPPKKKPMKKESDSDEDSDFEEPKKKPSKRKNDFDMDEVPKKKNSKRSQHESDSDSDSDLDFPPKKQMKKESDTDSDSDLDFGGPKKKPSKRKPSSDSDEPLPPRKAIPINDSDSDSDEEAPKKKPLKRPPSDSDSDSDQSPPPKKPTKKHSPPSDSDSDSDEPLPPKKPLKKPSPPSDSDSDEPLPPKKPLKKPSPPSDSDSDSDFPPKKRPPPKDSDSDAQPKKAIPKKRPPPEDSSDHVPPKKPARRPPPSDSDSDSDSDEEPMRKRPQPKRPNRLPQPPDSDSDEPPMKPKKPSKRKQPDTSESDFGRPKGRMPSGSSSSGRPQPQPRSPAKSPAKSPKRTDEPVWEVPDSIRAPYDPSARVKRLQQKFALARLVEKAKK